MRYLAPGTATATASVSSAVVDPVAWNDTALATTTITSPVPQPAISGQVRNAGNAGLPNVTVTLGGGASRTTLTSADGTYSFANLTNGASYTVTPSATEYAFTPASASFTGLVADQRADFLGSPLPRPAISGQVRDAGNAGLPNVTVALGGGGSTRTVTGADGSYSFTGLPRGATYP